MRILILLGTILFFSGCRVDDIKLFDTKDRLAELEIEKLKRRIDALEKKIDTPSRPLEIREERKREARILKEDIKLRNFDNSPTVTKNLNLEGLNKGDYSNFGFSNQSRKFTQEEITKIFSITSNVIKELKGVTELNKKNKELLIQNWDAHDPTSFRLHRPESTLLGQVKRFNFLNEETALLIAEIDPLSYESLRKEFSQNSTITIKIVNTIKKNILPYIKKIEDIGNFSDLNESMKDFFLTHPEIFMDSAKELSKNSKIDKASFHHFLMNSGKYDFKNYKNDFVKNSNLCEHMSIFLISNIKLSNDEIKECLNEIKKHPKRLSRNKTLNLDLDTLDSLLNANIEFYGLKLGLKKRKDLEKVFDKYKEDYKEAILLRQREFKATAFTNSRRDSAREFQDTCRYLKPKALIGDKDIIKGAFEAFPICLLSSEVPFLLSIKDDYYLNVWKDFRKKVMAYNGPFFGPSRLKKGQEKEYLDILKRSSFNFGYDSHFIRNRREEFCKSPLQKLPTKFFKDKKLIAKVLESFPEDKIYLPGK